MTIAIKTILDNLLSTQDHWQIQLLNAWPTIVGNIKTTVQLVKITDDTLTIGVNDSCWLQELYLLSPLLLSLINQKLDQPRINKLRFKITGTSIVKKQRAAPVRKIFKKNIELSLSENETLSQIKDEYLRTVLKDYLIRCYNQR